MDPTDLPGGAFIVREDGELARVSRQSFATEDEFQAMIARHPELLAGDLLTPEAPREWLLVARETGIADSADGADRWAVDHVFVDQDATPTFVEVKRRGDARLKRDVVGQILGYVAFATAYLTGERLRELFHERVVADGQVPADVIEGFVGDSTDTTTFWDAVERKLRSGDVRALVVADAIPNELRRVLEFLNRHMDSVHVAGVELQLYETEGYRTLVPRVIGQTADAEDRKRRAAPRNWTLEEVREAIATTPKPELTSMFDALMRWAEEDPRLQADLGKGAKYPSVHFRAQTHDGSCSFLQLYIEPGSRVYGLVPFALMAQHSAAYADAKAREELAHELASRVDTDFSDKGEGKYPVFDIEGDPDGHETRAIFEKVIDRLCATGAPSDGD